jgi:mortality factor 4-like protein 1
MVPDQLKVLLVDDWEAVTKNNQVRLYIYILSYLTFWPLSAAAPPSRPLSRQLVTLPRSPTVVEILEEFKQHVLNTSLPKYFHISDSRFIIWLALLFAPVRFSLRDPQVVLPTIISGLQVYFDKALGSNLLYRFERPQYAEIRKRYVTGPTVQVNQEREMSAIYGAEHLLRMIGLSSFSIPYNLLLIILF